MTEKILDPNAYARATSRNLPKVVPSAPSVVQQHHLMDSAGTAWHAVKYGNLEVRAAPVHPRCGWDDLSYRTTAVTHPRARLSLHLKTLSQPETMPPSQICFVS